MPDLDDKIHTLHRYFIWANRLRQQYDHTINTEGPLPETDVRAVRQSTLVRFFQLSYWLAALYVVIEGWQQLGLKSQRVDELLDREHVDLLKGYRNCVYHFQPDYLAERVKKFLKADDPVEWASSVHDQFSRFFLEWLMSHGLIPRVHITDDGGVLPADDAQSHDDV